MNRTPLRQWIACVPAVTAACWLIGQSPLRAQDDPPASANVVEDDGLPKPVDAAFFKELKENSPFTRSLNLSDSLILTGVARINDKPVATLMNRETKETYVISDTPNSQGWKMVDISAGDDLEKVAAKISVSGGEVVTVRFDEAQLKPGEAKPAAGPGGDSNRDGRGGGERRFGRGDGPPPEVIEKLRNLTEEQRGKMREYMEKKMRENPNLTSDERREIFRKALDRATQSR